MKRKWIKTLSISALLITLTLYGSRSYRIWQQIESRVPGGYYHGIFEETMLESKIMLSLNLPALLLSAPVRLPLDNTVIFYGHRAFAFAYSDIVYLLTVFFFWWWVGKQFDERAGTSASPGQRPPLGRRAWWIYLILAIFSVLFAAMGFIAFTPLGSTLGLAPSSHPGPHPEIASLVWGIVLSWYFISRLRQNPAFDPRFSRMV
jgi:hypothetical protein